MNPIQDITVFISLKGELTMKRLPLWRQKPPQTLKLDVRQSLHFDLWVSWWRLWA